MAKTKKQPKARQMNFNDAVKYLMQITDERSDQKFLENSKQMTMPLASLKARVEVIEDLLMEKLGETEASLAERVLIRVEKGQGFVQVDEPAKLGSIVRIKIKEELSGTESPINPMTDAFMVVGKNQIHEAVDKMLIGAKAGDTNSELLPSPKDPNQLLRITVFLARVFKGQEVIQNEVPKQEDNTSSGPQAEDQKDIAQSN